jgi:hypothetical protein
MRLYGAVDKFGAPQLSDLQKVKEQVIFCQISVFVSWSGSNILIKNLSII